VLPHEKYDGFLKLQTAEKLQRKSPNYKEVVALLKGGKLIKRRTGLSDAL
jgi:hypothetical protein